MNELKISQNLSSTEFSDIIIDLIAHSFIPSAMHYHPETGEYIGTMDTEGKFHPAKGFETDTVDAFKVYRKQNG